MNIKNDWDKMVSLILSGIPVFYNDFTFTGYADGRLTGEDTHGYRVTMNNDGAIMYVPKPSESIE